MTTRYRLAILLFALLGLGASVAALYVHYRLLTDPGYSSFCDISETVSCQQVFQSEYGSVFGVPVAAGGAIWSALVALLALWGLKTRSAEAAARATGYVFVLSVAGLAAIFYYAYASFFVLRQACPLCMAMYVSGIGVFAAAAIGAGPLKRLPSTAGRDLAAIGRSPLAATLAAVWVIGSLALVLAFPREAAVSASEAAPASTPAVPPETLTPEQIAEWEQWLASQPRRPEVAPAGDTKVLLLKFNDYQCPACRQTWLLYREIIAKYEQAYPGIFVFENRDFPLEPECGVPSNHTMACEAAVAVRLARGRDKHREMEAWLFANQSFSMTRDDVKRGLQEVAQITDFDARYAQLLEAVRADVQLGQKLGVNGTPTFFLNGIQLPSLRPAYLDAAIAWAIREATASGANAPAARTSGS